MDLISVFDKLNEAHFDGFLCPPALRWNRRLRSSAGRFLPGKRRFLEQRPPVIEVASYLLEEQNAAALIEDTIAHEMVHYWLWVLGRPYGHTPDFHAKLKQVGASRYNPVPRTRPYKYLYRCGGCNRDFPARRRLRPLACASCCDVHSGGRYDQRFRLKLQRELSLVEALELAKKPAKPIL